MDKECSLQLSRGYINIALKPPLHFPNIRTVLNQISSLMEVSAAFKASRICTVSMWSQVILQHPGIAGVEG